MAYTVKQVASLAHVSVRTLHHYDELGLLEPSTRSDAGYRLYDDADLVRLQQVLFFRELGFPLADIARIMNEPGFDKRDALLALRAQLRERVARMQLMAEAVDRTLEATQKGVPMDKEEMFEVFGDFDPSEHEDEVRERWGDTDAYKESARRTARYTKADWERIKTESGAVTQGLVALMDAGVPADDPRGMALAEEHRLQIDRWFYPCSYEMQIGLADMYIADPRFTATYEKIHAGLAAYLRDAIHANAARMT